MPPDDADGNLRVEILARKDVEVGIPARVAEVACDRGGLDQLHQGVAGGLGQVRREVFKDGSLYATMPMEDTRSAQNSRMASASRTAARSHEEQSSTKCLPHIV